MAKKRKPKQEMEPCGGCGVVMIPVKHKGQCAACERENELKDAGTFENLAEALRREASRERIPSAQSSFVAESFARIVDAIHPPVKSEKRQQEIDAAIKEYEEAFPE